MLFRSLLYLLFTGVAQAKAVVFFVLVAGLGLLQLGYTRKKVVQQ